MMFCVFGFVLNYAWARVKLKEEFNLLFVFLYLVKYFSTDIRYFGLRGFWVGDFSH